MLAVIFSDLEAFSREFHENLTMGGIFVPTHETVELRSHVEVGIDLRFCNQSIVLEGEVVHCVPAALASAGAVPGVAIQFDQPVVELRKAFEDLVGTIPKPTSGAAKSPSATEQERRESQRKPARVGARVCNAKGVKLDHESEPGAHSPAFLPPPRR